MGPGPMSPWLEGRGLWALSPLALGVYFPLAHELWAHGPFIWPRALAPLYGDVWATGIA